MIALLPSVPPPDVYLDTSIMAAAVSLGSVNSRSTAAFCSNMVHAGSRVYFSQLLRAEFLQAIRAIGTVPGTLSERVRRQNRLAHWGRDQQVREAWLRLGIAGFENLVGQFREAFEIPVDRWIWERSAELMARYQLSSYDALHAATALEIGVHHLATADSGFTVIQGLNVIIVRDS